MKNKIRRKKGGSKCSESDIASRQDNKYMYEFDVGFFISFLINYNRDVKKDSTGIINKFNKGIDDCDSELLIFISNCCSHALGAAALPAEHEKIKILNDAIVSDQTHDVWEGRCHPKLANCHHQNPRNHNLWRDYIEAQIKADRYPNISGLSNETFEYIIVDTKPHGTAKNLISGKKQINMITNVIDAAGCSFDNADHHYGLVDFDLETFILNLGFGFYQSYFKHLRTNDYHIYLRITFNVKKREFMKNKKYIINLIIATPATPAKPAASKHFVYEATGGGGNNGEFGIPNVCRMLGAQTHMPAFITFLNKALQELPPTTNANIITSICLLMKGFGDFGQMFTTCFLYNMKSNAHAQFTNSLEGNCMLTTYDTFLFRIADIFECPIVLGTTNHEYYLIDTSRQYKNKNFVSANNDRNKLKIWQDNFTHIEWRKLFKSDDLYDKTFFMSLNDNITTNALKNNIIASLVADFDFTKLGVDFSIREGWGLSHEVNGYTFEVPKNTVKKYSTTLLPNLNSILEYSKSNINKYIFNNYLLFYDIAQKNFILRKYDIKNNYPIILNYNKIFDDLTPESWYPNLNDAEFKKMRLKATKNTHYIMYLNALSEFKYISANFKINNAKNFTLFQLIQNSILTELTIKEKSTSADFNAIKNHVIYINNKIPEYVSELKPMAKGTTYDDTCNLKWRDCVYKSGQPSGKTDSLLIQCKIINDVYNLVIMHCKNIDSLITHVTNLESVKLHIKGNQDNKYKDVSISYIDTLIKNILDLLQEFSIELMPKLVNIITFYKDYLKELIGDKGDSIETITALINTCNEERQKLVEICPVIVDTNTKCKHAFNLYIERITGVIKNIYNLDYDISKLYIRLGNIQTEMNKIYQPRITALNSWKQLRLKFIVRGATDWLKNRLLKLDKGTINAVVPTDEQNLQTEEDKAKYEINELSSSSITKKEPHLEKSMETIQRDLEKEIDVGGIQSKVKEIIADIEKDDTETYCDDYCDDTCDMEVAGRVGRAAPEAVVPEAPSQQMAHFNSTPGKDPAESAGLSNYGIGPGEDGLGMDVDDNAAKNAERDARLAAKKRKGSMDGDGEAPVARNVRPLVAARRRHPAPAAPPIFVEPPPPAAPLMDVDGAAGGGGSTKSVLYLVKIEKLTELNKKLRKNKIKNKNKIEKNNKQINELKDKIKKEKQKKKEKIKKEKQKEKEKIKKEKIKKEKQKEKEKIKKETKQPVKKETKQPVKKETKQPVKKETKQPVKKETKQPVKKETKQKQQVKKQKDEKTKKK